MTILAIIIAIIIAWLFVGWLGWRLVVWGYTRDFDMTRKDRNKFRPYLIFGPVNLFAALLTIILIAIDDWRDQYDDDEIIYPRQDKR